MSNVLKVYSVVIAWNDNDKEQGDWGTYVRATDHEQAETLARLAMRTDHIVNSAPCGATPMDICEEYEGQDGFGGRIISCDEGAAWLAPRLEAALRAMLTPDGAGSAEEQARKLLTEIDAVDGPDETYANAAEAVGWEKGGDGDVWWHTSHGSWKNAASWGRTYATAREVIESEDYPEYQGAEEANDEDEKGGKAA